MDEVKESQAHEWEQVDQGQAYCLRCRAIRGGLIPPPLRCPMTKEEVRCERCGGSFEIDTLSADEPGTLILSIYQRCPACKSYLSKVVKRGSIVDEWPEFIGE